MPSQKKIKERRPQLCDDQQPEALPEAKVQAAIGLACRLRGGGLHGAVAAPAG